MPSRWFFALALLSATLGSGAAFAGAQRSFLYPPEVRFRPVIVVSGGPWQRHYWDPRYPALCPGTSARPPLCPTVRVYR